jgi:RNA polymerase sigma-70 factor (ECF subfamily)
VDLVSVEPVEGADRLEAVFREERPRLWRALLAFTVGRAAVAEDALSEAFARALAQPTGIRDPVSWLYRVAFRLAAAELTAERHRSDSILPEIDLGSVPAEELDELFSALQALPPNQRAAVFLYYQCDLPVKEIAARLDVSAATVRVHLWRGRSRLRKLLGGDEGD